jgi:L-ribulose-5-phosphate 3-epimerase/hexulose-6-phosphate isomerase
MKESAAMTARAGVILAMEIMDTEFAGTIVRAMHYLKEIPSPYFKIYPDIGNLSNFSNDVEGELELGLSETAAIHIKETKPGVFKEVPFGEGEVRFKDIFRKLKELNYQGMFLIEMWADKSGSQTQEEAVEKIAKAYQFVTEKMLEAGLEV